jgi:hypothetical protein
VSEPEGAGTPPEQGGDEPLRGMRALTGTQFSAVDAIGGLRGILESTAPVLLFVVVYLASGRRLVPAVIASVGAALVALVVRAVQRLNVTPAVSGLIGALIGAAIAWLTGLAANYFLYGLLVNAAYALGTLATILAGYPLVGLVVGLFGEHGPLGGGTWEQAIAWRKDPALRRRYALATWPWVAMFVVRLVVQVPLYRSAQVAWLGTAKLAMGLPLTALVLWLSWRLVRGSAAPQDPPPTHPAP